MPDVSTTKSEDMLACIDRFYEEMMKRSEDMKPHGELPDRGKLRLLGASGKFPYL